MSTFDFSPALWDLCRKAEAKARGRFALLEERASRNTAKILSAFSEHRVSDACFGGTTG